MRMVQAVIQKYAVAFGILAGLGLLTLIGIAIIFIPEEAGLAMTLTSLVSASISMFFIAKGFCRYTNHSDKKFPM